MGLPLAVIPLITKAGAGLAKLGTAMKGVGAAKAAGAGMNAAYLGKGKAAMGAAKKFAGDLGAKLKTAGSTAANMSDDAGLLDRIRRGTTSLEGFKKNMGMPMTKDDILMTVAPDLLFGGMAAVMTPGDLGDKAIAGLGSAAGGIAGGVGLRGVLGPKSGLGVLGTEMIGGIGGDMVGMSVADSIIRAKNGGMTPMEQQYAQQDDAYRQQIVDEFLVQNGLG